MNHHQIPFVFVYGTLRNGYRLNPRLRTLARFVGPARIDGFQLFNLGAFPAVKPGTGNVLGECWELTDPDALKILDVIEGTPRMYRRESTIAFVAVPREGYGSFVYVPTQVFVYVYVFVYVFVPNVQPSEVVPSGNWQSHTAHERTHEGTGPTATLAAFGFHSGKDVDPEWYTDPEPMFPRNSTHGLPPEAPSFHRVRAKDARRARRNWEARNRHPAGAWDA